LRRKPSLGSCKVVRLGSPGAQTTSLVGVCGGLLPQFIAQFNGASSKINVGNAVSLQVTTQTISAWIKTSWSYSSSAGYIFASRDSSIGGLSFGMMSSGGGILQAYIGTASVGSSTVTVNNGAWHHVVVTYSSANVMSFYVDGQAAGSSTQTGTWTQTVNRYIGNRDSGDTWFNGSIANVQIYNTSLDVRQIQALYQEGIGGAPIQLQNLVGWWPLNGDANDYSGNNNNGVPTNVVFTTSYTYP
jgi:hypothetical protein